MLVCMSFHPQRSEAYPDECLWYGTVLSNNWNIENARGGPISSPTNAVQCNALQWVKLGSISLELSLYCCLGPGILEYICAGPFSGQSPTSVLRFSDVLTTCGRRRHREVGVPIPVPGVCGKSGTEWNGGASCARDRHCAGWSCSPTPAVTTRTPKEGLSTRWQQ